MNKKFFVAVMMLSCLFSCGTDLGDIEDRINKLEQEEQGLKNKGDELAKEGDKLQDDINNAQGQLNDLQDLVNTPELLSFEFLSSDNPMQLVEDTKCEINEGNIVECWVLNIMSDKKLIPRFEYRGESLMLDGQIAESGVTAIDFSKPVTLTINGAQKSASYTVYVHSYTGLPVLWVETSSREDISKTNWYYNASMKLVEDVKTRAAGDVIKKSVKIKGLAPLKTYVSKISSSPQMAKNNYVLNFADFISLLDEPEDNDWDLRANDADNTMIRNQTGFFMSVLSKLDYTPDFHFVELMLNGRYYGTYMLGDHLEVATNRVNVGIDGYLLKIDETTTGISMPYNTIEQPVSILAPSLMTGDTKYVYIRKFMNEAESALFSAAFTTSVGWQKYLDINSFVDWYLINEIAKNEEAAFQKNCYMHMKKDGKLKMGPLWEISAGFGNGKDKSTDGFVVKSAKWFNRLFQDPIFVERVKERFSFFYSHKMEILQEMNENAMYLKYAVQENNNKWDVFDTSISSQSSWALYQNEVESMKIWLDRRMDWLNKALNEL